MLKAVLFKGNPKFVTNNHLADEFYSILRGLLEDFGYKVAVLEPLSHSDEHENVHLWVGHSMGGWYISINGPSNIKRIVIGSRVAGSLYHPKDNVITSVYWKIPNKYHYILTEEMKDAIQRVTQEIKNEQNL